MVVIDSVDQSLATFFRILRVKVTGDLSQHGFVEGAGDDLTVELLHIEIQLILQ